jgi:tetratricopeptide (TPR) repeat protein
MSGRQELLRLYRDVMTSEYQYHASKHGLDVLIQSGFRPYADRMTQFEHSRDLEHELYAKSKGELEAKVFLLAHSYDHVMEKEPTDMKRDWNAWLGKAECNLGSTVSTKTYRPTEIFEKSILHLKDAQEFGSTSHLDTLLLAQNHYVLGEYEWAVAYYEQTEDALTNPHRAKMIGSCYLYLSQPEESIEPLKRGIRQSEDPEQKGFLYFLLGKAFYELKEPVAAEGYLTRAIDNGYPEKRCNFYLRMMDY